MQAVIVCCSSGFLLLRKFVLINDQPLQARQVKQETLFYFLRGFRYLHHYAFPFFDHISIRVIIMGSDTQK